MIVMRDMPFEDTQPPSGRFQAPFFTMKVKVGFPVEAGFIDLGRQFPQCHGALEAG